jgi:hypothetical protein
MPNGLGPLGRPTKGPGALGFPLGAGGGLVGEVTPRVSPRAGNHLPPSPI